MEENENQNPIQNENTENFAQVPPTQEPNPVQNQDNFDFNFNGDDGNGKKKKKGMGPVKGLLLAIFIVVLIFFLGLLIRMVIAGDNDYFKPIKDIFGIEDKKEVKNSEKVDVGSSSESLSGERYTLLVSDAEDENVSHYRMTIDLETLMNTMVEQMTSQYNQYKDNNAHWNDDEDDSYYDDSEDDNIFSHTMDLRMATDDEDDYYDDSEDDTFYGDEDSYYDDESDLSDDEIYSDDRFRSSFDTEDDEYGTDYLDSEDDLVGSIEDFATNFGTMMSVMGDTLTDMLKGEVYFDVYFEGNELVQVVIGVDYGDTISKVYDYIMENSDEDEIADMESEGVESAEDLADYMANQFKDQIDIDTMIDDIFDDTDVDLSEINLTKSDLRDALNVYFDRGIVELYLTGTKKINKYITDYIESDEFDTSLGNAFSTEDYEIDLDDVYESLLDYFVDSADEFEDFGMVIEKIN